MASPKDPDNPGSLLFSFLFFLFLSNTSIQYVRDSNTSTNIGVLVVRECVGEWTENVYNLCKSISAPEPLKVSSTPADSAALLASQQTFPT